MFGLRLLEKLKIKYQSKFSNDIDYYIYILFFFYIVLLACSSWFDWDYFHTTLFIDTEIIKNFQIPKWSYKFCGGVSRIGDPQSFGLNPLILIPIIWGPIIGSRLMIIFALVIAYLSLKKIFEFYEMSSKASSLSSFGILTSSFYINHFHHGHLTFISFLFSFYIIKVVLVKEQIKNFSRKTFKCSLIFIFLISGGGHPGIIYFLFPFFLATLIIDIFEFSFYRKISLDKYKIIILSLSIAAALSYYKISYLFDYQKIYPRTVDIHEVFSVKDHLISLSLPLKNFSLPFGLKTGVWHEWENNYFSLFPFLLVLIIFRRKKIYERNINYILTYVLIFSAFSLGYFSDFSPFAILNKYFLNNSLRVSSRFFYGGWLFLAMYALISFFHRYKSLKALKFIVFINTIIIFVGTFSDGSVLKKLLNRTINYETLYQDRKRDVNFNFVKFNHRGPFYTDMLSVVLDNYSVLNCYNPLNRDNEYKISKESFTKLQSGEALPFITSFDLNGLSDLCLNESYISHQSIYISKNCPSKLRLRLNSINIYAPANERKNFKKDRAVGGIYLEK
jgi:hypothetical protein